MFESDDWDLDQDFPNDVDDKSTQLYSATDNNESEPKRRKIDIFSDPISSIDNDVCDVKNVKKCDEDKVSRKNLILSMFNKNLPDNNISQGLLSNSKKSTENNSLKSHSEYIQSSENSQLPRKNLVLGILNKKNVQDKVAKNNIKNLESPKTVPKIKSNSNINLQQQGSTFLNNNIKCQTPKENIKKNNCLNNDNSKQISSELSRKQLLCNILKQRSVDNAESKNKAAIKPPQVQTNKKMTIVRRFPGPAGLLPDDIDASVSAISYLNSLEENEAVVETNDTDLPEYCSQNTKDLFTEGAWQLMLNDLPDGFLKGYEIATIKQMANANGYSSTKIEFLAGIVERIDHNHENPPIVLKDFTGTIQGIVHRDIPLKYPGLLESNVVILLCDVGLLKISGSLISNKYQILIAPSSLLAIYSNKGKIERTHYMESVLEDVTNGKVEDEDEIDQILTRALEEESLKIEHTNNIKGTMNSTKSTQDINTKSFSCSTDVNKTFGNMKKSMNFDSINDISFSVSSKKITDTQKKDFTNLESKIVKHINEEKRQLISNKKETVQNDVQQKSETLLQSLKKYSPNANASKKFSHNSKILQMDVDHPVSVNTCTENVETKMLNDRVPEKMDVEECDVNISQETEAVIKRLHTPCYDEAENIQYNTVKKNKISVRSRLMQFKNTNTLTQSQNADSKSLPNLKNDNELLQENKLAKIPKSSSNVTLYNSTENDSDDEILSQLDMDVIFSNYSK
ncbi:uncharacterized protein LOC128892147 [Hylaeus anthracinus]|uniref:uncharacterized protein LOC128892147 n=1 Tax=Hylaeus anthracinus TaxID=313031 RepID=UPI0023B96FA6|nr:uncharacterized protein LOC128892147 [Hylaeus anthracinus]